LHFFEFYAYYFFKLILTKPARFQLASAHAASGKPGVGNAALLAAL
jgi:hypothetical protein